MAAVKPSNCSPDDVDWIQINNDTLSPEYYQYPDLKAFETVLSSRERVLRTGSYEEIAQSKLTCEKEVLDIALKQKQKVAKWMIGELNPADVDEAWRIIATAVAQNQLGSGAKIAPQSNLIIVYVHDFSNIDNVLDVLKTLKILILNPYADRGAKNWGFKPDIYTMLGITGKNKYQLFATIYRVWDGETLLQKRENYYPSGGLRAGYSFPENLARALCNSGGHAVPAWLLP